MLYNRESPVKDCYGVGEGAFCWHVLGRTVLHHLEESEKESLSLLASIFIFKDDKNSVILKISTSGIFFPQNPLRPPWFCLPLFIHRGLVFG